MSEILGTVVGLFVQRHPLKQGRAPLREYRTDDIVAVPAITVDADGVMGHPGGDSGAGAPILDVHHRRHPESRDRRGRAGISLMAVADHELLRARYGDHVVDGSPGCTILLDTPGGLAGRHLVGLRVHTAGGGIPLTGVVVADPCVEFSRFCLGEEPSAVVSPAVRQALVELDGGHRGYRAVAAASGRIVIGDRVEVGHGHP